ncbi:MAG: PAS domain S-box protein, partial [Chitinophagaceae bacterium]
MDFMMAPEILNNYVTLFEALPGSGLLLQKKDNAYFVVAATADALELTGKLRSQLYHINFFTLFSSTKSEVNTSDEQELYACLQLVAATKIVQTVDTHLYDTKSVHKDNLLRYRHTTNSPVLHGANEVEFIVHFVSEETNNIIATEAEEAVRLSEQTMRLLLQAPIGICIITGRDLKIELANAKIREIWRKDEEVKGKSIFTLLPEIEGTRFPDLLWNVMATGNTHYEYESSAIFLKDGKEELVYFNFVYQPYYELNNDVAVGVMVVANEVSEQVRARIKVEESEQRYRTLISEAAVATAIYAGKEMSIQYANEAMLRLWGKDEKVIGTTVRQALPELEGQPFHELLAHVYSTGETYWGKQDKGEIVVDGELQTFFFNFTYKALRNHHGEIYAILNMAIDVTDQVRVQQQLEKNEETLQLLVAERTRELEQKNKQLQLSNAELQQFAFVTSHDLQEPLRKIRTFGDMLSKIVEGQAKVYVQKMIASAERMSGLIIDLLEYSKLSHDPYRFHKVDLNQIVQNVLADYELLISQKQAVIEPSELPVIMAIPLQMNQLFYNLIGNALKFSGEKKPTISIKGRKITPSEKESLPGLSTTEKHCSITVKDNGIGFDISVKTFSIFLLLAIIFSSYPYYKSLYQFFVLQNKAQLVEETDLLNFKNPTKKIVKGLVIFCSFALVLYPFIAERNFNDDHAQRPIEEHVSRIQERAYRCPQNVSTC